MNSHPVRRCAPCDRDWPNTAKYNLCPCCQRCTFASTTEHGIPDHVKAMNDAERYRVIREFDAKCDAEAQRRESKDAQPVGHDAWSSAMRDLLAATPSIPDPEPLDGRGDA